MSKQYVGDQIEIESSTDTPEQVKTALGPAVEIEESPTEETETEKKPPAKVKAEEPEPEADETETEEEETEEEPAEEAEAEEEKPKKKAPPTHVPLSRLNKEIAKVKRLERQLEEKDDEPEPEAAPAAEVRPQNYSGKPEPKIEDYTGNPEKYPDPYVAYVKDNGAWNREEARAEAAFNQRREAFIEARNKETELYQSVLPQTLERRPDYWDVMKAHKDTEVSVAVQQFCEESEIGPDLLLYIVEHPKERKQLNALRTRGASAALTEIEERLKGEIGITDKTEEEAEPEKKVTPPPKKKLVSQAPPPANRLKPAGPGPKSLQELAGPTDKQGIDIEFNPEYERQTKARKRI